MRDGGKPRRSRPARRGRESGDELSFEPAKTSAWEADDPEVDSEDSSYEAWDDDDEDFDASDDESE